MQRASDKITIEATGGIVRLHGKVHTWEERNDAGKAAWSAPGVSMNRRNGILVLFLSLLVAGCATAPKPIVEDPRIGDFQKQVAELQSLVDAKTKTINELNASVSQLQTTADSLKLYQDQLAGLQKQLDDKIVLMDKLSKTDSKLQTVFDANTKLQATIADITKQLNAANSTVKNLITQKQSTDI